jgi:hypothetical protein
LDRTYPTRKDDDETVFSNHHALLDGEAKHPTESYKPRQFLDLGQHFEELTLNVLPIPDPQAFRTSDSQQGAPIASRWCNTRSGQEQGIVTKVAHLPNGEAHVIVLVVGRSSGGHALEFPPTVRNSSVTTKSISNT